MRGIADQATQTTRRGLPPSTHGRVAGMHGRGAAPTPPTARPPHLPRRATLNWSHLETFLVLYREGSVARAAARLRVEPSTLSRRLTALEEDVGGALFLRTNAGLRPTETAVRLAPIAEDVEAKMRLAAAVTSLSNDRPSGLVRVAATEILTDHFMVPALPGLLEAHPELDVELSSGSVIEDVAGLEADLALRFVRPTSGDVIATRLRDAPMAVLGAADRYRDAPIDWGSLDWISWKRSLTALPEARWLRDQFGVEPRVGFNRNASVLAAVRAGAGVGLLPRRALQLFEELIELEVPEGVSLPVYEMWLVKPTIHRDNPAVNAVAAWIVSLFSDAEKGTG